MKKNFGRLQARDLNWLIPLFFIVTAPLWLGPVKDFLRPRTALPPQTTGRVLQRSFTLSAPDILQHENGKPSWRLKAAKASTGADENDLRLETVDAILYGKANRPINITSGAARLDVKKKIFYLTNHVLIRPRDQYLVTSAAMRYRQQERILDSDTPVRLTGSGTLVQGDRMNYNMAEGVLTLEGHVVCVLKSKKG